MAAVVPAQQVLQAAFGENPQNLQVLHFDPSRGETALCRIFLRRGACKWGDLCRHSHEMDLSSYSLRARRGAAMPALVQGDPKAALETASENIAFVLSGPKAVYDFEDPHVARSFLAPAASDLWAWLPWELAVDTLWSAGPRGAVSACMACKDWGPKQVAQGLRERFYREVTGADFSGCTWRHLCDFMLTRRLLHSARGAQGERRALVDQGCGPVVHICQPSPVFLLFLDGAVTFALLRSGEVRCHRSSTGQILGQSTRLGKGRQLQAAALLGCEAFVLGDDQGGLVLLLRDDLSESQQLRSQGPPGGVASMAALQENQQACVAVNMDGSIELIQVNLEDDIPAARIHPVCRMDSLQMIPAICTYNFADTDFALVTAGPRRVWSITLDADQQCQSLMSEGTEPPMPDAPGMILTFFMLLSFKLAAEYKKSQVAARVLTSDQASASYDLIEDEASHQPRMEPQGTEQSSEVPTHRFTAKKFAWTLLLVAAEAAVYGGLVTTLSASKDQLEPCTERCLQFKFFGDGSAIPGTGMFPFPVKNGQDQRLLSETCVSYGGMDCDAFIGACSVSRCEERHVRRMVEDRLSRSKSKMGFIASIAVYSALNLAHDLGLEAHLLGPNDAVMLQIFASLSMAVMAACALMWASGAMELFYSPSESCGCYFRLAAVPSVVALALPLNLVSRLRSNVQQAMYAVIIESSCLRTVSFSVPYHFIETAGINGAESLGQLSLLGVKGLVCPRPGHVGVKTHNPWLLFDRLVGARSVKRWAQWLPLLSVGIILFPLLFSSSFIVYRISDLFLAWLEDWLSKHVGQPWQLDRSCGTLALFGVYSMIGMQALVIGYFLSGLWTLYSILAVQLGDWPSDPQMLARLISAKPELRWTLSIARRSYTR